MDCSQVAQPDLALALEDVIDVAGRRLRLIYPLRDVADPLRVLEVHPWDLGDIAEIGTSTEAAKYRLAGGKEPVDLRRIWSVPRCL